MKTRTLIPFITVVAALFAASGVWFHWWLGTPEYSLYRIRRAYRTHDYQEFIKYFDVDGIADRAGEEFVRSQERPREITKKDSLCCSDTPLTFEEKVYWKLRVRWDTVDWYRSAFNKDIPHSDSEWLGNFSTGRVQVTDGSALVDITNGEMRATVRMIRISDRIWKVTEITDWELEFGKRIWH